MARHEKERSASASCFQQKDIIERMNERRLEAKCPLLKSHLSQGDRVLDVGCSAGSMTLDAAGIVNPGLVTGIDIAEAAIQAAREAATREGVDNAEFRVDDAYHLSFSDATFDVCYSLAVLVWLRNPIAAVREQARVTKPGGRVVASIGDFGSTMLYPPCPTVEKLIAAWARLGDDPEDEYYVSFNLGCRHGTLIEKALRSIESWTTSPQIFDAASREVAC